MGFRYFVSLALGLLLASPAATAQQPPPPPVDVSQGAVTILTDGITNPNSPALRAMSEISLHLDKIGDLRVLPLMGYGGEANVRDLLSCAAPTLRSSTATSSLISTARRPIRKRARKSAT